MRAPLEHPRRCQAKRSRDGEPCRNYARRGTTVCDAHGGAAPQVQAAAERRLAEAKIRKELEALELEPLGDPVEELVRLAAEAKRWYRRLARRVDDMVDMSVSGEADKLKAEVPLFERAMDRLAKLLDAVGRLNLDERRVRVLEAQMLGVDLVAVAVMDELGFFRTVEQVRMMGDVARFVADVRIAQLARQSLPLESESTDWLDQRRDVERVAAELARPLEEVVVELGLEPPHGLWSDWEQRSLAEGRSDQSAEYVRRKWADVPASTVAWVERLARMREAWSERRREEERRGIGG